MRVRPYYRRRHGLSGHGGNVKGHERGYKEHSVSAPVKSNNKERLEGFIAGKGRAGALKEARDSILSFQGVKYVVHPEPWHLDCFSDDDLASAGNGEESENILVEIAEGKAAEIAEKEGWDGMVFLYPDESGVEYGLSIFYRRSK